MNWKWKNAFIDHPNKIIFFSHDSPDKIMTTQIFWDFLSRTTLSVILGHDIVWISRSLASSLHEGKQSKGKVIALS